LITNENNLGGTFRATVVGKLITIENQSFQDSFGDTWSVSSNSGALSGNSVQITVKYDFDSIELECIETWNKQ